MISCSNVNEDMVRGSFKYNRILVALRAIQALISYRGINSVIKSRFNIIWWKCFMFTSHSDTNKAILPDLRNRSIILQLCGSFEANWTIKSKLISTEGFWHLTKCQYYWLLMKCKLTTFQYFWLNLICSYRSDPIISDTERQGPIIAF